MKKKSNMLSKAGVLLLAVFMVSSVIPAVTADTSDFKVASTTLEEAKGNMVPRYPVGMNIPLAMNLENSETLAGGGMNADNWISYNDGSTENALGLTNGGLITMAIELTSAELAGFYGQQITEINFAAGSDGQGPAAATPYQIWIETSLPVVADLYNGNVDVYKDDTTDGVNVWQLVTLDSAFNIPASGSVFVGVNYDHPAGEYPCGIDEDTTTPPRGGLLTYEGSSWTDLGTAGFPGVWGLDVGVSAAGPGPGEDCIPDACDFAIDGFTDEFMAMSKGIDLNNDGMIDYYAWNSLDHDICIKIANKGEIGIGEVKLLADVYEKVCGPTITIFDNPKYDLQLFPCCGNDYPFEFPPEGHPDNPKVTGGWIVEDDGDQDSWALQGGSENRVGPGDGDTQAWRCTKGEDRSFGADEDVYLGKSDLAPVGAKDNLTTPAFDIAGAACAEITFQHWTEGEYTTDTDGNIIPADYGTIAYSLDGGATWMEIPKSQFLAYDNDWEFVTLKFINTEIDANDADYMHPYSMVCDDCQPEDGDIVIEGNLSAASLMLKFVWHKDPCLQFEGWYVDSFTVQRTEDYELEWSCQTHDILEMDPCDAEEGVVWEDYCFPFDCSFDEDTWYEVHIVAQVFDPQGCEADISNNEFKFQFKIEDIHDMACIGIEATGETKTQPGESVPFNVTVQNQGTFAEDGVPVSIQVGDLVKNEIVNDRFETDSLGEYSIYYFLLPDCNTLTPWRWTKGDASISQIYEADPNQARSRNPGSESIICAEEGVLPYLPEDTMTILATGQTVDLDPNKNWKASGEASDCADPVSSELSFDMKYSLDMVEDTYYGGYYPGTLGSMAMLAIMPTEGPASGYVLGVNIIDDSDGNGYENDWVHVVFDDLGSTIYNRVTAFDSSYDYVPECEIGFWIIADGSCVDMLPADGNGGCTNPFNPIPWTGFMFDNLYLDEVTVGETEEFTSVETGELMPGETQTFTLGWESELCAHGIVAETQLAGDINPANDKCCVVETHTTEIQCPDAWYTDDMTGGGDCLWHVCTNRENGDDYFAWAGVETEQSARYVNNMDDRMISPSIDLSEFKDEGVLLNFTTWYKFADNGDFGEVDILDDYGNWQKIGKFTGTSNEAFEDASIYIPEADLPAGTTKLCFRMVSDGSGVDEGWFIDDIMIFNVTDDNDSSTFADEWLTYNDGYTDNALAWTDGSPWVSAIELDAAKLAGFTDYDLTDVRFSTGCDEYGFYAEPYNLYYATGSLPDIAGLTPIASGTSSGTGWDTVTLGTPQPLPDSGSAYVIVEWYSYSGYPAGFDTDNTDTRGQWMLDMGTTNSWTTVGSLGYPSVWGIDAGIEPGASGIDELTIGDPIWAFPWDEGYIETFERGEFAPWTCEASYGGQYWEKIFDGVLPDGAMPMDDEDPCDDCTNAIYTIRSENLIPGGYISTGAGLDNAIAFTLDLTGDDPDKILGSNYIVLQAMMTYNLVNEKIYIEFSPDWEPGTPMESATWVEYWSHTPGDNYGDSTGGWVTLEDLTGDIDDDNRWNIEEYYGKVVHVRFRLESDGNGAGIGEGWAITNLKLEVKEFPRPPETEPPVTSIFFDSETAQVTLVAVDYPLNKGSGVAATYYKIDGGEQQTYGGPFTIDEGTHTVEYWSVDQNGNTEPTKSSTFTVDTSPPTVTLTSPEEGGIYLLGNKVLSLGSSTFCIGKVPVAADASDAGTGVNKVLFDFSNGDSGFDESAPYEYTFRAMHFGSLVITARAVDNNGLVSSPDEMTVTVFSLGLL